MPLHVQRGGDLSNYVIPITKTGLSQREMVILWKTSFFSTSASWNLINRNSGTRIPDFKPLQIFMPGKEFKTSAWNDQKQVVRDDIGQGVTDEQRSKRIS